MKITNAFKYFDIILRWFFAKSFVQLYPGRRKPLWLISERGYEAQDNGFALFKYIKDNHPEVNCRYVISFDSPDIHRLDEYKEFLVDHGSIKHYFTLAKATHLISTHICGYTPDMYRFMKLSEKHELFKRKKKIFLQHGITKDNIRSLYGDMTKLDLFVCGAQPEYDYINENFKYPKGVVKYLGLCRYDALNDAQSEKMILIMPTWRKYIDKTKFAESEYYLRWKELLQSTELHDICRKNGLSIVFYPHYEMRSMIHFFQEIKLPEFISIREKGEDIQSLLKRAALLLTDYSSVYFDVAYMHKPVIYYQFDSERFFSGHYSKGYFKPEELGFLVHEYSEVLNRMENLIQINFSLPEYMSNNIDKFFPVRDNNNCKRNFAAISML